VARVKVKERETTIWTSRGIRLRPGDGVSLHVFPPGKGGLRPSSQSWGLPKAAFFGFHRKVLYPRHSALKRNLQAHRGGAKLREIRFGRIIGTSVPATVSSITAESERGGILLHPYKKQGGKDMGGKILTPGPPSETSS